MERMERESVTSVQVNQIIQTFLRDKEKMNEIMFNNSLNVRRKISAGGANQGAFLPQEIQLNLCSV